MMSPAEILEGVERPAPGCYVLRSGARVVRLTERSSDRVDFQLSSGGVVPASFPLMWPLAFALRFAAVTLSAPLSEPVQMSLFNEDCEVSDDEPC